MTSSQTTLMLMTFALLVATARCRRHAELLCFNCSCQSFISVIGRPPRRDQSNVYYGNFTYPQCTAKEFCSVIVENGSLSWNNVPFFYKSKLYRERISYLLWSWRMKRSLSKVSHTGWYTMLLFCLI